MVLGFNALGAKAWGRHIPFAVLPPMFPSPATELSYYVSVLSYPPNWWWNIAMVA